MNLRKGTIIETKYGVYIILGNESDKTYKCIQTSFADLKHINLEEVHKEDILGSMVE